MAKKKPPKNIHDLSLTDRKFELTQSAINMFLKCPEQFRRRYVERDIIPPSIVAAAGTGVHRGAQHNFQFKLEKGQDAPTAEVVEVAVEALKNVVSKEGVYLSPEEQTIGKDKLLDGAEQRVISLTTLFRKEVAPPLMPLRVEHEHLFKLPSGVTIKAHLDMETTDQRVLELKTTGKAKSYETYQQAVQTTLYHLVSALVNGKTPLGVQVEQLITAKPPRRQTFLIKKCKDDYEAVLNLVDAVAGSVKAGVFPGAFGQQGAWWCSKKFCGYWATCPFIPKYKR